MKNIEAETRDFKLWAFCRIKTNVVITSDFIFFQISGIFPVLVVSYLQIQQTKNH